MNKIYPNKLKKGYTIRVIAPSRSMSMIGEDSRKYAKEYFENKLDLRVTFGKNVEERDHFVSSSVESRVTDLHEAFLDSSVKAIFTIIGGFNCNQILDYIDWDIIKNNPKIFCGFSDITALNNAIYAKTGLVTYSGPHYSTFGQKILDPYTPEYLMKCLFEDDEFDLLPSKEWNDDAWYINQDERNNVKNDGYWVINEGKTKGTILGANLCTFNLIQGTEYMPSLKDSILFLEDDSESRATNFDRDLHSIIHQKGFSGVKGIVIGRFQRDSEVSKEDLQIMIKNKKELEGIPVVANVDFGHTDPKITFPVGGECTLDLTASSASIKITKH
jgi:muramoyltetrapeptide carboxypeptidase LdcA involved in peptidoglycan recycling